MHFKSDDEIIGLALAIDARTCIEREFAAGLRRGNIKTDRKIIKNRAFAQARQREAWIAYVRLNEHVRTRGDLRPVP